MTLEGLSARLLHASSFAAAVESGSKGSVDFSVADGLRAPLLAGLLGRRAALNTGRASALFAIVATSRDSELLREALASLVPEAEILDFPSWETLPHERLSPSSESVGSRLHTLRRLKSWETGRSRPIIVVASVRAALQPLAAGLVDTELLTLKAGSRAHDLSELGRELVDLAYQRVDMVTRRGEFAVRGGILDVFPPTAEHPIRADFFGDEIEELREFSVTDQRSFGERLAEVELPPSRELLLTESVRQRARELRHEFPNLGAMLEKIAEGIPVEGMESLGPVLADRFVPVTEYLPKDAAIAVVSPERVATRAVSLGETNREFLVAAWSAATAGAEAPVDLSASFQQQLEVGDFLSVNELRAAAGERDWWTLSGFDSGQIEGENTDAETADDESEVVEPGEQTSYLRVEATAMPNFSGNPDGALGQVEELLKDGWSVVITAAGTGLVERAAAVLAERGLAGRVVQTVPESTEAGVAYLTAASVEAGFRIAEDKFALFSEAEFFGRSAGHEQRQVKKLASRRKNPVDPLQLKAGDYVVHETHGIGRFIELVQRDVSAGGSTSRRLSGAAGEAKISREYLLIEYAPAKRGYPGDKLYVPTDQLDLLTRYVGGEAPALSRMGGSDWAAAKGKARRAVRDIAVELVKLYSARMASKGHAFGPDTPWQHELEEAFPFIETPDQLSTIDEVKADMERQIPMDRLLAGDVGYGKTEIAVRAAFKAIQGGKQVAMLVPTTLLVRQHMETFAERYAGFPIHLRALSRFQSDKEARETLAGLADGTVDMVIGTHRLLNKDIRFKDLGLVVVDEEQRFGVEHKEALKKLKTNVDVLAMSATPIPRTLEMAVTGIREMSTLATPPEDRHPILTFVGPYSQKQVAAAIRRELLREGQVFFVHNRVSSINRAAAELAELVPEARIAVAHGQLPEGVLEQVMVDFWERKFDVLVSTTIIETGIDITNANTLIIDRADKYGLSQLHQIRGRVGRGRERAFAYFLYDENKPLSETAHDRLATIAANNELGGGMQIALKDLEIRGAGNLLGGEQSGHISGVGFDLYLRMIGEAVSDFRGEEIEGPSELRLELPVAAHIPEDYVDSERLRLEAYQKLSAASSASAAPDRIDAVVEELTDRYGKPPAEVENLVAVTRLRRLAQRAGLTEMIATTGKVRTVGPALPDSVQLRLQRLYRGARYISQSHTILLPLPDLETDSALIDWATAFLTAIYPEVEKTGA